MPKIVAALRRNGSIPLMDFFEKVASRAAFRAKYAAHYPDPNNIAHEYDAWIDLFGEAVKRSEIKELMLPEGFAQYFSNRTNVLAGVLGEATNLHALTVVDALTDDGNSEYFTGDYKDPGYYAVRMSSEGSWGLWLREFINTLGENRNLTKLTLVGVPSEVHLNDLLRNFKGELPFILEIREKFSETNRRNRLNFPYQWAESDQRIDRWLCPESALFKRFGPKIKLFKLRAKDALALQEVVYNPAQPLQKRKDRKIPLPKTQKIASATEALSATHHTLFDIKKIMEEMGGSAHFAMRKNRKPLKIDVTLNGHKQVFYEQGDKRMRKKQVEEFLKMAI